MEAIPLPDRPFDPGTAGRYCGTDRHAAGRRVADRKVDLMNPRQNFPASSGVYPLRASPSLRVKSLFLLLAALSISCTHKQITRTNLPAQPTIWDRQVRNAVDA